MRYEVDAREDEARVPLVVVVVVIIVIALIVNDAFVALLSVDCRMAAVSHSLKFGRTPTISSQRHSTSCRRRAPCTLSVALRHPSSSQRSRSLVHTWSSTYTPLNNFAASNLCMTSLRSNLGNRHA